MPKGGIRGICSYPNCQNPHRALGFCGGHYAQKRRGEDLHPLKLTPKFWIELDKTLQDGFKHCRRCGEVKPRQEFSIATIARSKDGRYSYCLLCERIQDRFFKYGITEEELILIFEKQQGKCAICQIEIGLHDKNSHVDHCHVSKNVRGILCAACNKGLGHYKDDPELLEAAAKYLRGS